MASMDELFDPNERRRIQYEKSDGKFDENALRAAGAGSIYNGPTQLQSGAMGTGTLGQGPIGFRGMQVSNISLDGNRTGARGAQDPTDFGPVGQNPSMTPGAPGYTRPSPLAGAGQPAVPYSAPGQPNQALINRGVQLTPFAGTMPPNAGPQPLRAAALPSTPAAPGLDVAMDTMGANPMGGGGGGSGGGGPTMPAPVPVQRSPYRTFEHAINRPLGLPDQSPSIPIGGAPAQAPAAPAPVNPNPLSNIIQHSQDRSIFNQIDPKTGGLTPQSPRQEAPAPQETWIQRFFKRKPSPMRTASLSSGIRG